MIRLGRYSGLALATAIVFVAAPSYGQSAESLAFFRDVNARIAAPSPDAIASLLKDGFERGQQKNSQVCIPASIAVSDIKPATADAGVWIAIRNSKMVNAWTVRATMTGCPVGSANYLVIRFPDDSAGRAVYRPIGFSRGTTHAGFSISKDAMNAVVGGMAGALTKAKIDVKTCGGTLIVGPREITMDGGLGPDIYGVRFRGDWKEKWHFQECGHDVAVPVHFMADGHGGANFDVNAGEVELK
ncbi:hypothetical protein [Novosphingobium sp.]|uniref:hypothetical protein n=1 Tax=Novosphingobium sp. TaxID=1874826 RepID=UPI003D0BBEF8